MPNCVHCGQLLPEGAAFCIECGKPRAVATPAAEPRVASPAVAGSRAPWWVAGLLGVAMMGTGLRQWFSGPSNSPSPAPPAPVATATDQGTPVVPPPVETPLPPPPPPPPEVPPATTPSLTVLYESEHDLDGDGREERVRVISLEANAEPNSASRKQLQILSPEGDLRFVSEPFEEPFHTDLDELAESTEGKAGLHILPGTSEYPRIRLIFAARSGNFVDFRFNGQQFELAEFGD